jgi:hypothetical protein
MADGTVTIDPVNNQGAVNQIGPVTQPAIVGPGSGLGGATTPGQDFASTLLAILSGIKGFGTGPTSDLGRAQQAAAIADPYAQQRSQWWPQIQQQMTDIQGLMADPTKFLQSPMFTAPLQLGGENLARQFGAAGMGQSGNVGLAETQFGQSFADQYLQEQLGNMRANMGILGNLGGVNAGSPAAAGQLYAGGAANQNANQAGALAGLGSLLPFIVSGLGSAGGGLVNWLKSIGGGGSNWASGGGFGTTGGLSPGEGTTGSWDLTGGGFGDTGGLPPEVTSPDLSNIDWGSVFNMG